MSGTSFVIISCMKKVYYNKLIRDGIPEVIVRKGGNYETRVLLKKEFEKELKKKLIEESKELAEAPKRELLNELSDVLEIIKSIAFYHKINFKDVEKYQLKKIKERGGFMKRLFLIWSSGK